MKTVENVKKVALIFFIILGTLHLLSSLMIANSYFLPWSLIINRILDIPFALSALIYGFSSISCKVKEEKQRTFNTIFGIITVFIFLGLVYINFFLKDRT